MHPKPDLDGELGLPGLLLLLGCCRYNCWCWCCGCCCCLLLLLLLLLLLGMLSVLVLLLGLYHGLSPTAVRSAALRVSLLVPLFMLFWHCFSWRCSSLAP